MYRFKLSTGFSLIELMVVMAIMAVVMSLSGGLMQKSIGQQERHVELEKVHQLFSQLSYLAYYQGGRYQVRLEDNRIEIVTTDSVKQDADENAMQEMQEMQETVTTHHFNQLKFVAESYQISSKGVVSPLLFGVFSVDEIKSYSLSSVFQHNEA